MKNSDDPVENTMLTVTRWGVLNETQFKLPTHLMAVDVPRVARCHGNSMIFRDFGR